MDLHLHRVHFLVTIALRVDSTVLEPRAGSRVVRIDPLRFPGRMSYKATKPDLALPVVYLSIFYYPRRARSALGVDTVLTLDVCMFVCMFVCLFVCLYVCMLGL